MIEYQGGCHCARVRFKVLAPEILTLSDCNCSVCCMSGYLHLIVPESQFTLLSGAGHLTTYTFNTGIARHMFCKICGIKSFYVPRSHPDGISVNARCIDRGTIDSYRIESFDGRNWEQNIDALLASGI